MQLNTATASNSPTLAIHALHAQQSGHNPIIPSLYGVPLKYISLVTLAVQNAALTIIMHTSRTTIRPSRQYSAAAAVLLNELVKGSISLAIAVSHLEPKHTASRGRRIFHDVFSTDCWKLTIPALLYVVQNNLQYVAASNLDAATFQVTYQMKILTTAGFSVLLLRKQLSTTKWCALFFLAIGVGIVQIQSGSSSGKHVSTDSSAMAPLLGFFAVTAACFTSGLAGVYFELVLKNTPTDLWVRNVQLSLFSLLPALIPALLESKSSFPSGLFRNFGVWAWATVLTQVLGGLTTAVVIKYADNILKGFATSLAIVISFIASVVLFDFVVTLTFVIGASIVLGSTWLYNQPTPANTDVKDIGGLVRESCSSFGLSVKLSDRSNEPSSALGSPVDPNAPILGHSCSNDTTKRPPFINALAKLSLSSPSSSPTPSRSHSPRLDEEKMVPYPLYTPPVTRPSSPRLPRPSSASTSYNNAISRAGSGSDIVEMQ